MRENAVKRATLSVPRFRSAILVAACFFFLSAPLNAQTLQGNVQSNSSSGTDIYSLYAGQDPLRGKPEQTPTSTGPKGNACIGPNPKWQLITQIGNMCYWYAPFPKRLAGYVVPMFKISWVESTGGRCGVNPFSNPNDPNGTAICNQPPPAKNPYAPKGNAGKSADPSMPMKSGCDTQGTFIPHCYYTDSSGKPTSNPNGNTGPYCFYQDEFGIRTSPPVLCVIRAYPRTTTPTPLFGEQPAEAADQPQHALDAQGCATTLKAENDRHTREMERLGREPQITQEITQLMTEEDNLHDRCVAKLKAAQAAPPASPARVTYKPGNFQKQPDGSYQFRDSRGTIWSAPGSKTTGGGIRLAIDPKTFGLKQQGQQGNEFSASVTYRGTDWNGMPKWEVVPVRPMTGNWTQTSPQ